MSLTDTFEQIFGVKLPAPDESMPAHLREAYTAGQYAKRHGDPPAVPILYMDGSKARAWVAGYEGKALTL